MESGNYLRHLMPISPEPNSISAFVFAKYGASLFCHVFGFHGPNREEAKNWAFA